MSTGNRLATWGIVQLRPRIIVFLPIFFSVYILYSPAQAASFDCGRAELPVDKLICQTPELSKLDEQMADSYKAAGTRLAADQISLLRDKQRQWLKSTRSDCKATDTPSKDIIQCIQSAYESRIEELNVTGPYIFEYRSKELTRPAPADEQSMMDAKQLVDRLSYPQIISPLTGDTRRWNDSIRVSAEKGFDGLMSDMGNSPNLSYLVKIHATLPGFISIDNSSSWMGNAHYYYADDYHNQILATGADLTADQIFKADSKWLDDLAERAITETHKWEPELKVTPDIAQGWVQNAQSWNVSATDLTIKLDLPDTFGYAHGPIDLVVPWRELKPYLRDDLPIKLNLD